MAKSFARKLALSNFRRNMNLNVPYLVASILTMTSYFIMLTMLYNPSMDNIQGSIYIKMALSIGNVIITIFMVIFMMYFNSFLIKKRKKEFGLYSILGLEKRHIARVIVWENCVLYFLTIVSGLVLGFVFGKLLFLLLLRICKFSGNSAYSITGMAVLQSVGLYVLIFFITSAVNVLQVMRSKTIDLLKSEKYGEKKARFLLPITLIGLACLIGAYYRANIIDNFLQALLEFFLLAMLVILATYLLFTAGSVTFLHLLRKQKKIYYKPNNFIAISGLIYRMKQNAAGLAGICILSTMVLIVMSGCFSLYLGEEEAIGRRMKNDLTISSTDLNEDYEAQLDKALHSSSKKNQITLEETYVVRGYELPLRLTDGVFTPLGQDSNMFYGEYAAECFSAQLMTAEGYESATGKKITLLEDECYVFANQSLENPQKLTFEDLSFQVKGVSSDSPLIDYKYFEDTSGLVVVFQNTAVLKAVSESYLRSSYFCTYSANYSGSYENGIQFASEVKTAQKEINQKILDTGKSTTYSFQEINLDRQETYALYGGLLFLGIFFVILFLTATILIIYFKQVSEGYEDKERFEVLQKVGMDSDAVKKTIDRQVLIVFFLPLVTAILHTLMARHIVLLSLKTFYLYNNKLVTLCMLGTGIGFAIVYFIVYLLTSRIYFRIVKRS